MKLIKPYYEIITPINGEDILKQIELAARTCYKSEGKIEYEEIKPILSDLDNSGYYAKSARILIPKLISRGHEAMLEFGGNITVKFVCDRGVSHELVRHRLASFAQESTRYCNYNHKDIEFIIPSWFSNREGVRIITEGENKIEGDHYYAITVGGKEERICLIRNLSYKQEEFIWLDTMAICQDSYNQLIENGWSPQQARRVLPNSLKTEINVSTNIREWRHIFKLRTAKAAHPQMRELMCPLLDEFKSKIPILFDDINY